MVAVHYWGRRIVPVLVLVSLLPTASAGLTHFMSDGPETTLNASVSPENLTVVTTQGGEPRGDGPGDGMLEGVRTTNGSTVWIHDRDEWYYDVDPIDNRTLLIVSHQRGPNGGLSAHATEWDWVANETLREFRLPPDTHDVDRLDEHRYVVADKYDHRAFVYNYTTDVGEKDATDDIVWQFRYENHYPSPPTAGDAGDYTHLNDVDLIDDGDAFLLSPRNFDRVMAVNRTTKEVEWTLGEQDTPSILHGQHDPIVVGTDPLTVLVGDSLNHRVVEYERVDDGWERTWSYNTGLNWPRDVDRLPNGNTIIADTANDRVVEVAPNGSIVWEYHTTDPHPYDVERVALGDEPAGPTMEQYRASGNEVADGGGETPGDTPFKWTYRTLGWVLPVWVDQLEFFTLLSGTVLGSSWVLVEAGIKGRAVIGNWMA